MEDEEWTSLMDLSRSENVGVRTKFEDSHKVKTDLLSLGCLQRIANAVERLANPCLTEQRNMEKGIRRARRNHLYPEMFGGHAEEPRSKIRNSADYICDELFTGYRRSMVLDEVGIPSHKGLDGILFLRQVIDFSWSDKRLLRSVIRGKAVEAHAIRFDEWRVSVGLPKLFPFLPRKAKKPTKRNPRKKQEQQATPTP